MITFLWTALGAVMLFFNLAIHEAMHARALREMGGDISAAGLGMPFRPMLTFPATRRRKYKLTISIWLLAAYVMPTAETEKLIPTWRYRDQAWYAGAGVVANAAMAGLLLGVYGMVTARLNLIAIGWGFAAGVWVLRKPITWILPLLSIPAVLLIVFALTQGGVGGPIAVGQALIASDARTVLVQAIGISVGLAVLNTLPIFPLDGGRVVAAALAKVWGPRVVDRFQTATAVVALALVVYLVGLDVAKLAF